MTEKEKVTTSKFMSQVLRHRPEKIGITLDKNGWTNVDALIEGMNKSGRIPVTLDDVKYVVATNDKQRFTFNEDFTKIRANQGHSIPVDVELEETAPPAVLYHGTSTGSLQSILENGIIARRRLYVHLSGDIETAIKVGKRHGKPVVLNIDAVKMYKEGYKFFLSANGVWLTEKVPIEYVSAAEECPE